MTDKELQRLSRRELLEMLLSQTEENEALRQKLAQAEAKLQDRAILFDKAGSLAEAALSLNGVFQAADEAARQYRENLQRVSEQQDAYCRQIREKAEQEAARIRREAEQYSKKIRADADGYLDAIITGPSGMQ